MKITIEIDSYFAGQVINAIRDLDSHYTSLDELAHLIDKAQREAIVAKASGKKPGEGPWELHPYAERLKNTGAGPVQPAEEHT